jgi:hypothetical protein
MIAVLPAKVLAGGSFILLLRVWALNDPWRGFCTSCSRDVLLIRPIHLSINRFGRATLDSLNWLMYGRDWREFFVSACSGKQIRRFVSLGSRFRLGNN